MADNPGGPQHELTRAEMFATLVQSAGAGIGYYTLDGRIVLLNPIAAIHMGGRPEDFAGRAATEVFSRPIAEMISARIAALREVGTPLEFEDEVEIPTGRRWFLSTYSLVAGADGAPAGVQIVSQEITARKRSEHALRESEARFRRLFEDAPVPYQSVDADGRILDVNQEWLRHLGYRKEDVLGSAFERFQGPACRATFEDRFTRFKAAGEIHGVEVELVRRDGSSLVASFEGRISHRPDGSFDRTHCIFTDVTERRRLDAELERSEARFRELVENLNDVVYTVGPTGVISYVSPAITRVLGHRPEELVGCHFAELVHPDDRARIGEAFRLILEGVEEPREYRFAAADGSFRWVRTSSRRLIDGDHTVGIQGILTDITERRRAQLEVERSREKLVQAQRVGRMGSWEWHIAEERLSWSEELYRIWGVPRDFELSLEAIEARIHPADRARNRERVAGMLGDGGTCEYEMRIVRPNGEIRHINQVAEVTLDRDGRAVLAIGIMQDITERRRAEAELRARERLLDRVFETLPVGLWLADRDGRLIRSNPEGRRIWGAEPLVPVERYGLFNARRLPGGEPVADDNWALAQTIREGATILDELLEIDAFDGQRRVILNSTAPVLDERGAIEGAVIVNLDVTERERSASERQALVERVRGLATRLAELDEERRRTLARELHDRVGQSLTAISLNLGILRSRLAADLEPSLARRLDGTVAMLEETTFDLRTIMTDLRPPVLDELGLVAALEWMADQVGSRHGLEVTVAAEGTLENLPPFISIALYRIVQEALANVVRHACVSSARVSLTAAEDHVEIRIEDRGIGFDPGAPRRDPESPGWGIIGMTERAEAVGGTLAVSSAPGRGSRVTVRVPR